MSTDLRTKTARGSFVTAAATMSERLASLVGAVFLARLLDPNAFGLMALAMIVLQTTKLFSGLGMRPAVVQSRLDRRTVAFHAFLVSGGMGTCLFLTVCLNAPLFAAALGDPNVEPLLRWISLVILFDALSAVPEALLRKDLLFGRQTIAVAVPRFLYMVMALSLATFGFGLWSLAYATVTTSFVSFVLFWWLCPGWDWLKVRSIDVSVISSLVRYGFQVTVAGLFAFLTKTWDKFLVGRFLGAAALGFFSRAYYFASLPVTSLEQVVSGVLFASYSQMQGDEARLSRAYTRSVRLVSMLTVPMALGIFVIASEMVPTLLGRKWNPMIPPLQILSLMCLVGLFARSTAPLYLAMGRPNLNTRLAATQSVSLIVLSLALVSRGVSGVAIAVTASAAAGFVYNAVLLESVVPGLRARLPKTVSAPMFAGCLMVCSVHLSKPAVHQFAGTHTIGGLIVLVALGVVTYTFALFVLDRSLLVESFRLVSEALGRKPRLVGEKSKLEDPV